MSICYSQELNCPYCGKKLEVMLWDSINAQLDPEAREALLQGKIHTLDCPICKKRVRIDKPLLYHDIGKKFFIMYYPFKSIEDQSFLDEYSDQFSMDGRLDLNPSLAEEEMPSYSNNIHYVFSMNELGRYILFRENLADIKDTKGPIIAS